MAADAFLHEIDAAFEGIAENPSLWPQYLKQYRRRVLTRFPFRRVPRGRRRSRGGGDSSRQEAARILGIETIFRQALPESLNKHDVRYLVVGGRRPLRVKILTSATGADFEACYLRRVGRPPFVATESTIPSDLPNRG